MVIGGGDTGADCVGTVRRQGAKNVTQVEILAKPPETRESDNPWPEWPQVLRTSSSHEEGCTRIWSATAKEFLGSAGRVEKVKLIEVEWYRENGRKLFREKPGSEFEFDADLVVLAMGFLHIEHGPLVTGLNLETTDHGNLKVDRNQMTSHPGVFAAGDSVSGPSLVVRAIAQGRKAAEGVQKYLVPVAEEVMTAG